jgi:hypothetical protein
MRMGKNKLPVKAYNQRRSGYKAKGRPRVRWIDFFFGVRSPALPLAKSPYNSNYLLN